MVLKYTDESSIIKKWVQMFLFAKKSKIEKKFTKTKQKQVLGCVDKVVFALKIKMAIF